MGCHYEQKKFNRYLDSMKKGLFKNQNIKLDLECGPIIYEFIVDEF